jgi:Cytosol aminopeptidase family, N-terminal domain
VKVIYQDIKTVECDAIVVGFYEDVRPLKNLAGQLDWLLCGSLSLLLIEKRLQGVLGEVALLTSRGKIPAQKIFLIGLGPRSGFTCTTLKRVARIVADSVASVGAANVALEYFHPSDADYDNIVRSIQEGLKEGGGQRSLAVSLVVPDRAAFDQISRLVGA